MTESQARYKKVRIVEKVQEKLKEGIENYRAAGDAPAKYDVYDVIEEIFAAINPPAAVESKVTVDEVNGCLRSSYLDRKDPSESTHQQMMKKRMHKIVLSIMEKPINVELDAVVNVILLGRAD